MKLTLAALTDAERERAAECVHESGAVACVLAPSLGRLAVRSCSRSVVGGHWLRSERPRLADVYAVLESG